MIGKSVRSQARGWRVLLPAVLALLGSVGPCPAQELSLQEYGQAEGLRNLAVSELVQDASGFVWAGTQNGLYRLDGGQFERIGLAQGLSAVSSLLADGDRLWIGADDALWLLQGDRLQRVQSLSGYPQNIARAPDGVWVVDGWRLFLLTRTAGGRWNRQEVQVGQDAISPGACQSVTSVVSSPGGELWFGRGDRLFSGRDGRFEAWGTDRGVPKDTWHWLLLASDGSVWARGEKHVLQRPPGAAAFVDRTDARDLVDPLGRYPLVEDAEHRIVGAARGVLERWDGHAWERFGVAAGLPPGGRIHALLSDRGGGMWIGMLGLGMLRWRGYGRWESWSVASGLPHTAVWGFARTGAPDRPVLQVATGLGVASLDEAHRRFVPLAATKGKEIFGLASDPRGALWVGTATGTLLQWPAGAGPRPIGRALVGAPSVANVLAQRSGDVWVETDAGLFHRAADAASDAPLEKIDSALIGPGSIHSGCENPDGTAWFGGDRGVLRFARGRWDRPWTSGASVMVLACLRDGSVLASGGNDGVHRLLPEGAAIRQADVTPPLLRGLAVLSMHEDRRGWWWIGTDAGVAVGNGQAWRLLDRDDGLIWDDTSSGALFEDTDGSMWVGTSRGLSHLLDPSGLFAVATSPTIVRALHRGDQALTIGAPVQLPWSPEPLEIDLAMPAYGDRHVLDTEYRLLGFDDRWTHTAHLDIRLTGLPPGRYRFEARAVDRQLGAPSPSVGVDFEIEPPWWRTPLAFVAEAILTALAGWLLMRWRLQIHVGRERQLHAIVAERTKELVASRERLRELAAKDGLTGVWNRRALTEILEREALRCTRERLPLAVAMSDIDHFKKVNDTHGHPAGDAVLREFAARLTAGLRPYDAVGRYGGEEFVIVMPGLDVRQPEHRARLAAIHECIAATPMSVGTVTCSFGVAGTDGTAPVDVEALIASADAALYRAKHAGRDRIEWSGADSGALSVVGVA